MKSINKDMWRMVTEEGKSEVWFDDFYQAVSEFTKYTQWNRGILEYHHKGRATILFNVQQR